MMEVWHKKGVDLCIFTLISQYLLINYINRVMKKLCDVYFMTMFNEFVNPEQIIQISL